MPTLLERIRTLNPRRSQDDLRQSVLENLQRMCATRLGSALACPKYGLPDVVQAKSMMPEAAPLVLRALQETIAAHEPRLTRVQVRQVAPEGGSLRFEITGYLADRGGPVTIRTQLGAGSSLSWE